MFTQKTRGCPIRDSFARVGLLAANGIHIPGSQTFSPDSASHRTGRACLSAGLHTWGRKPLLLIAFGVLPIRGVLYTLTSNTALLVAIQVMDGIGAGIFGVVSVLVIADLTRGTGRFNLTLGAIATAVGIGAALSQVIAGSIVHHLGYRAGFLFLAGVASAAFAILYFFMPETRNTRLATE